VNDYPTKREKPLEVPATYLTLIDQAPISQVLLPTGNSAWLITGHELARQALAHPRLSADSGRPGFPLLRRGSRRIQLAGAFAPSRANMTFLQLDPPYHDDIRQMLRGSFSHDKVRAMRPMLQQIADELVETMRASGPPVDLIRSFAAPFPAIAICKILGIPPEDRDMFERETHRAMDISSSQREAISGLRVLIEYFDELITKADVSPPDGLLGRLVRDFLWTGKLGHDDLLATVRLLVMAGLETTANMTGIAFTCLLRERSLYRTLRDEPAIIPAAIEELLRFQTIVQHGIRRVALEDIRFGAETVRQGEGVIISVAAANRDSAVFDQPHKIDFGRDTKRHLSFSGGIHYCLGHILARAELDIALSTVVRAFPSLRLDCSLEDLRFRDDAIVYGVQELPVTWS
jgi:cytochrome P450